MPPEKKKNLNKPLWIKKEVQCDGKIEIYQCGESLVFVPIDWTNDNVKMAYAYASRYALDLWSDGKCDSFDVYLTDAGHGVDVPHVYVTLFKGVITPL